MKIGFLVNKEYFDTKLSRIRFEYGKAIKKLLNERNLGDLIFYGKGWDNYNNLLNVQQNSENLGIDLILSFKPLDYNFFDCTIPVVIAYNETFDIEQTLREIKYTNASYVIFHHYNDFIEYKTFYQLENVKYFNVAHSADENVFKVYVDGNQPYKKIYDCLLVGANNVFTSLGRHYPLRDRLINIISSMPEKYKCGLYTHPPGKVHNADNKINVINFAKAINCAKIALTCSGIPKSRFGKYIEIPMCGTAIAADIPDDEPEDVKLMKEFIIEINLSMTDKQIIDKLIYYIENDQQRDKLIFNGLKYVKNYTLEKYADRFLKCIMGV